MKKKLMLLSFSLGLAVTALTATNSSAASQCETDCQTQYNKCQVICSKHPCLVSCQYNLDHCLAACGSES